jgi:hypothetical protein
MAGRASPIPLTAAVAATAAAARYAFDARVIDLEFATTD